MATMDVPFDLTILFFDDAFQWCEYLFDLFQPYDLTQNSERINDFPTNEVTLSNIKRSVVQLVIISPQCVESCSTMIEKVAMPKSTIGLVCGTNEEDIELLYQRIPSARSWKLVDTAAKTIVNETMSMIKQPTDEEEEHVPNDELYVDMMPNKEDQVDLYLAMDNPISITDQMDLYEDMADPTSWAEDSQMYEDMVPRSNSFGEKVTIIPSTARCGRSELVVLLFENSMVLEGKDNFTVEFCRGRGSKTIVPALKANPCTLTVQTPNDQPAGRGLAIIYSNATKLATSQFTFQSSLDVLTDILGECANPIEFMCETLNISPADHTNLDSYLSNLSKKVIDTDKVRDVFGVDDTSTQRQSNKEYPTILHFAAKYGLSNLCVAMLNMPCVVQALNLSNCSGKTPPDLAEESGFSELNNVLRGYQNEELYAPIHQGPNAYVEMNRNMKGKPSYGNSQTSMNKIRYVKPFKVPIPAYRVEELVQGTPEDVVGLYDTLPVPVKSEIAPVLPIEALSIEKKNEENEEHNVQHAGLDPGQLELIELQKRVARKEITVDEAVKIFENYPSFMTPTRSPVIDPLIVKKEMKLKKVRDGKKGHRKIRTRSQSSPVLLSSSNTLPSKGPGLYSIFNGHHMMAGASQTLPNRAVETFRSYRSNTSPSVWHTASPVAPKAKRSHSVNMISTPSNFHVHSESALDNLSSAPISKSRDTQLKERAMSCVESVRARGDDGSPRLLSHDNMQQVFTDGKGDSGSRPSSIASSHSRGSTCSRDSSILNFDEDAEDARYMTMQIPLPAIPGEEDEEMVTKIPHREPPAIPSRIPEGLPDRFAPPPPRPIRPTPAPRKKNIND